MKEIVSVAIRKTQLFAARSQELVLCEGYWSSLQLWFQEGYYVMLCTQCTAGAEWKGRVIHFSSGLFGSVLGTVLEPTSFLSSSYWWNCSTRLLYLSCAAQLSLLDLVRRGLYRSCSTVKIFPKPVTDVKGCSWGGSQSMTYTYSENQVIS